MLLIHNISSPAVLYTLNPMEISYLIDIYISAECIFQESQISDPIELLKTISLSPALMNNIPSSQIVKMMYQMSKLAPTLLCVIPLNVSNTLLTSVIISIQNQSPETLVQLTLVISSSPYMLNKIRPSIISSVLTSLLPPHVLSSVPPTILLKLLTNLPLKSKTIQHIEPEAVINILHSIKSKLPNIMCDLSSSARFAYGIHLTTTEVTNMISIQTSVKLFDIISDSPCFFAKLPSSCIQKLIAHVISKKSLLNAIPQKNIFNLIGNVSLFTPSTLREIPHDYINQLIPLNSTCLLNNCLQFLSSFTYPPLLMDVILDGQVITILNTLSSSPDMFKEIPCHIYIDIFTQIFTTPKLLSKIPLNLLLNLLVKIDIQTPNVICTILPSAISTFMNFLGNNPSMLTSISPTDLTSLVYILTKFPCFLTQLSVNTLTNLLDSISIISRTSHVVPTEIIIKLIYNIYLVFPSIFCSLPPESIREIVNTFDMFGSLNSNCLIELITIISECPCILPTLEQKIVTNLIDVLSASPSILVNLKPSIVINLLTQISLTNVLSAHSFICFLQTLSTIAPFTLSSIPTSVSVTLLKPLHSLNQVNELILTDMQNLLDILIRTPDILAELPQTILINLLTAMSTTFAALPSTKIILFLTSINSVSPSLMCIIPDNVIVDLTNILDIQLELSTLPLEFVVVFTTILSSSPRLLETIPATTLNSLLSTLSSSPEVLKQIPSDMLVNFLTKLSLTPLALKRAKLPLIITLLSAIISVSGKTACSLPSMVVHSLLVSLVDLQIIYKLKPTDIASLLGIASSAPCVLNAIAGTTLNTLLIRIASSPNILTQLTDTIPKSLLSTLASSSTILKSVHPMTLVMLMTTITLTHPTVLSSLPQSVADNLLTIFNSQSVFASFSSTVLNSFISLLISFPKLLNALPLSSIDSLLCFMASNPTILSALPTCTLFKFLAVLSSLSTLKSGSSITSLFLIPFISTLSTVSPKFLCILPSPIVINLIGTLISPPALDLSTPKSVASLISILNRSRCLITILPYPSLTSFLGYLSSHSNLLSSTPDYELIGLINNIESLDSIQHIMPNYQPYTENHLLVNLSSFQVNDTMTINTNPTSFIPNMLLSNNDTVETIYTLSDNNKHTDSSGNDK